MRYQSREEMNLFNFSLVIFKFINHFARSQPQAKFVDPLITILFSIIVIFTTVRIMKQAYRIVMEAVPSHVDYDEMRSDLYQVGGVMWVGIGSYRMFFCDHYFGYFSDIDELRVWSLTHDHHIMTAKLVLAEHADVRKIIETVKKLVLEKYQINDVTIETK